MALAIAGAFLFCCLDRHRHHNSGSCVILLIGGLHKVYYTERQSLSLPFSNLRRCCPCQIVVNAWVIKLTQAGCVPGLLSSSSIIFFG
jgi:mannitol-specific phosphotransferase system IIBC component